MTEQLAEKKKRPYYYACHVAWTELIVKDKDGELIRLVWDGDKAYSVHREHPKGEQFAFDPNCDIHMTNPNGEELIIRKQTS